MTRVYFVRHAQPLHSFEDDRSRPLTEEGLQDTQLVLDTLRDKEITVCFCSPYLRSLDTIRSTAEYFHLNIQTDERFRERESGAKGQGLRKFPERWKEKEWREEWGESLESVQRRNIEALKEVLEKHRDQNILIGTHGTALSTILSFYQPSFGYEDFVRMMDYMPNIVELDFEGQSFVEAHELAYLQKIFHEPPSNHANDT